jgi:hypothetical protein
MTRRIVMTVLVVGSLIGLAWAFNSASKPKTTAPQSTPNAVLRTFPPAGDLDLRQVMVGVLLAPGYTGDLYVDGRKVPEDELKRVPALYQITLQPRPGGEFALGPGHHCASVRYWRIAQPDDVREAPPWCFDLH